MSTMRPSNLCAAPAAFVTTATSVTAVPGAGRGGPRPDRHRGPHPGTCCAGIPRGALGDPADGACAESIGPTVRTRTESGGRCWGCARRRTGMRPCVGCSDVRARSPGSRRGSRAVAAGGLRLRSRAGRAPALPPRQRLLAVQLPPVPPPAAAAVLRWLNRGHVGTRRSPGGRVRATPVGPSTRSGDADLVMGGER